MKKILSLLSLVAVCGVLSACNTIAGAGKDVQRGGDHIQDAAHNVQKQM